jgi:microcystin-dependent protein
MSQQYLGELRLFPYGFAPKYWAYCAGQILSIQQNSALFSLLGTTYGGNGQSTFALPDLRGRTTIGTGTGNGGTYAEGQASGFENVTLVQSDMPMHNHLWQGTSVQGDKTPPTTCYVAAARASGSPAGVYGPLSTPVVLAPTTLGLTGGSQPHNNMQPYTVLAYCIATQGIFPSRN